MAKFVSISLMDEEISAERLMEALNKLSSRDLRKYFKRKKMAFPRPIRYAFLSKCIKRDFQAVPRDLLAGENRVFTEFELVEFYKCVENAELAKEFKKDFLAYFVKATYKNLLTDKNLAELYQLAESKEEASNESIHSFLVGLNPIFADTEENNLDCLPVETTAQRIKDQFTLFEVREFAKKYGVVVPKYPNSEVVASVVIEKARAKQLLDEPALENLSKAEVHTLMSFAKKNRIYAPRYVKKDEVVDEVISQIASKEIDNVRMNEVFNENLITFKSRSSSDSLCDLLDKYENLDDLSEVRNDNSKDMSPIKRCAVGGAIGLELKYNEESRKARLQARREKLEVLRQQALERKERLAREKREQDLINQRDASLREREEEEAKRLAAEQRIAELEALLAQQEAEREAAEAQLREEEERRLALEKALEEAPKYEVVPEPVEEPVEDETPAEEEPVDEEVIDVFGADEIIVPEYVETTVLEEYETEEEKEVTYMAYETVEEVVPQVETVEEPEVVVVPVVIEEEPVEEETPAEEPVEEETPAEEPEEEPIEVIEEVIVEEEPVEEIPAEEPVEEETPTEEPKEEPVEEETPAEEPKEEPTEEPKEEEPKPEPVKCPVNKLHVKGWVWSVLAVVVVAVLYFLVEPFKAVITNILANGEYTIIDFVGLYFVGVLAVGVVAFLVRFILHKITCKAKKGKACCKIGEVYKYLWTHLIVAVIAVFAFMQANLFHFSSTIAEYANILSKIFAAESVALDSKQALMVIFAILIAAYVVTLIVCSLAHALKCKKGSNPSIMRHLIIFLWSYVVVIIIAVVALVVFAPQALSEVFRIAVENVTSVFSGTALVVNAAGGEVIENGGPDVIAIIFTVLFAVVIVYILGLSGMTVGYAKHVKKQKAIEQEAQNEKRDEVEEISEEANEVAPVEEKSTEEVPAKVEEDKVVVNQPAPVEEEKERLLFTTFEEAKLVEDLNDLNRMIGKVNEHVKDLSAIQARLYNELVGEEEIVIEPVRVEEDKVVAPEPAPVPAPVVEPVVEEKVEEPVVEEAPVEAKPIKVKPRCKVRTAQKVWWILFALLVVAGVVCYFVLPQVPGYVEKAISALKDVQGTSWGPNKTIGVYGVVALAVVIVACILRTLCHPVGCRAKKEKPCRHTREFILYVWTLVILAISAIVALYLLDIYKVKELINEILTFNFAGFDRATWFVLVVIVALVVILVWVFVGSIKYANRDKIKANKEARKAAKLEAKNRKEEAKAEEQSEEVVEEIEKPKKAKKEKVEKPKKEKKVKEPKEKVHCKVRTMQKVWFVLFVIIVIAGVVGYFTTLQPYYLKAISALKDTTGASWGPMKTIGVYGAIVLAVVVVSFILRFIAHPVGCKAKKERLCTVGREFVLFLWTAFIVGVSAIVACYFLNVYRVQELINNVLTFDFASFGKTAWVVFAVLVVLVVLFIVLIIAGIKTKANEVKRVREAKAAKLAEEAAEAQRIAEEEARKEEESKMMYFPVIVGGQLQMLPIPTIESLKANVAPVEKTEEVAPVVEEKVEEPVVEEKPKKEKKVKEPKVKVNCPVRKTQVAWWIILVVVALAAAAVYFFAPNVVAPLVPYFKGLFAAIKDTQCNTWTQIDSVCVFAVVALVVMFLAFILRTIAHPIGCKVNKDRLCTRRREFLLFLWTSLILGVATIVLFYYFDIYRARELAHSLIPFDFASFNSNAWIMFAGIVAFVIFVIILFIASIKTKVNEVRRVKEAKAEAEAEKAEEEAKAEQEQNAQQATGTFFPLIVNGQVQMVPVPTLGQTQPQTVVPQEETPVVEEKPKKEKKEKKVKEPKVKVNCPVRKTQKVWWIVLVVVAVLAAVALYLAPNTSTIVKEAYDALTDFDGSSWGRISKIGVYGVLVLVVLFLAFVWRTLVHPVVCKAKKNMHCCHGCEFIRYIWTVVVIGLIALVVLYFFDLYLVKHYVHRIVNVVKDVLTFDFASFTKKRWVVFAGLIVLVIAAIWLVVGSIKHKVTDAKKARIVAEAEKAEEEALKEAEMQSQMQPNVSYFPMMLNGQIQMIPVATMNPVAPQQVLEQPKDAEEAKKEKKVKEPKVKVNCPVRKTQKVWWIVLVVVAVLAAVALYLAPNTSTIVKEAYDALTDFDGSSWGRISKIGVYGVLVLVVLFLAFVWRTLVHPVVCKAKKNMHCCHGCEFIRYIWTVVVIGLIALVVLYFFDLYLVKHYVHRIVNVVKDVLTFDFASFTKKRWVVFAGLIVLAIAAIWLVVGTIKHKKECRRLARYEAEEAEINALIPEQQPMNNQYGMPPMIYPMQQPVVIYQQPMYGMNGAPQYNTGVYEDLNSPYNQYRINDEPRGRRASKYHGKHRFLKFIFVVAVLAVAYIGLAYFTKGLPGDDTIRNLVNRFIEIIK